MLRFSPLLLVLALASAHAAQNEFKNVEEAKAAAFKNEEKGLWKEIDWRRDPIAAQAEAAKENKPILVFMLIREWNRKESNQYCAGGRATRGRALSDAKVISLLNKEFIPFELNLTDQKFPESMPALAGWNLVYSVSPFSVFGFTSCVIITPDGKTHLGNAGDPSASNWQTCPQYHGDKFVAVLEQALKKYKER